MTSQITVQKRDAATKPKAMRREGRIPGVVYGHRDVQSLAIELDGRLAEDLLKRVIVNNTIVTLKIEQGWSGEVLLREVQMNVLRTKPQHLSFFAIAGHGSITLDLPIAFTGEARGVRLDKGVLDRALTHLSVSARPDAVPEAIEVDVTNMGVGDVLYIKDLVLPVGVDVLNTGDTLVATVAPSATTRELESMDAESEAAGTGAPQTVDAPTGE